MRPSKNESITMTMVISSDEDRRNYTKIETALKHNVIIKGDIIGVIGKIRIVGLTYTPYPNFAGMGSTAKIEFVFVD